jgi:thiol:disulfide interchange protein
MLKRNLFVLFISFLPQFLLAQEVDDFITWNFSITYEGDEAILNMIADQKDHWHMYSQEQPEGSVAWPTEFTFEPNNSYIQIGKVAEYGAKNGPDSNFPEKAFYGEQAIFKQRIKIKSDNDFTIKVNYSFMICKEVCLQPTFREFTFKVKGAKNATDGSEDSENLDETVDESMEDQSDEEILNSPIGFQVFATYSNKTDYNIVINPIINGAYYLRGSKEEVLPVSIEITGAFESQGKMEIPVFKDSTLIGTESKMFVYDNGSFIQPFRINRKDSAQLIKVIINYKGIDTLGGVLRHQEVVIEYPLEEAFYSEKSDGVSGKSYWGIFFLAFGGGLLALLTPCVFPMIPMTVSFFTKGAKDKKKGLFRGVMYGLFIFGIYVLLSLPFHLVDKLDPSILNSIGTNGPLNLFFFTMLALFAVSFLGAFEITMPSRLTNSADKKSNLGGLIGIFFMALTLALVSFSCTGPILGGLLASASSATGGAWNLTVGMAGFGVALGLPFALFAIFPGWLNKLPQSGGWLNNVKVTLGLLELALAFKFLSVADIYYDAHLLERELFIAIWAGIFLVLAMYLFGFFKTKHDSPTENGLPTFRIMVGTFSFIFALYLIPGLLGAPVKLVSPFAPPESYSEIPLGIHGTAPPLPEGASYEHGLIVFHDFKDAERYAKEEGKPIMIDFTGENCVNCRKMENNVWSADKVHDLLKNDFVIASLYVDDREELPAVEISPYSGRTLETWGDKWADWQSLVFKKNSQPQYVILDKNGGMINSDASYRSHGDPTSFQKWLKDGKQQYKLRGDIPIHYGILAAESSLDTNKLDLLKTDIILR